MLEEKPREIVRFKISQAKGYFALLTDCVLLSKAASAKGLEPYFFFSAPMHLHRGLSRNFFDYYFEQNNLSRREVGESYCSVLRGEGFIEIRDRPDINAYWCGDESNELSNTMNSIREGAELFHRNIQVKRSIVAIADRFWSRHVSGRRVLGVHYRGTDKFRTEAAPVDFEAIGSVVRDRFGQGYEGIFLATDDLAFFRFLDDSDLHPHLVYVHSPRGHDPQFLSGDDNFRKGAMAVLDSLLLSKCDLLVKTPSLLSAWSKVFRPDLELVLVGRPRENPYGNASLVGQGFWPERCFWMQENETHRDGVDGAR